MFLDTYVGPGASSGSPVDGVAELRVRLQTAVHGAVGGVRGQLMEVGGGGGTEKNAWSRLVSSCKNQMNLLGVWMDERRQRGETSAEESRRNKSTNMIV